jgi:hypothetical protein
MRSSKIAGLVCLGLAACAPKRPVPLAAPPAARTGWVVVLSASLERDASPTNRTPKSEGLELAVSSDPAKGSLSEWHAKGGPLHDRHGDHPVALSDDAARTKAISALLPLVEKRPQLYSPGRAPSWLCEPDKAVGPDDKLDERLSVTIDGQTFDLELIWGGSAPPAPAPVTALLAILEQTARAVAAGGGSKPH